MPLRLPEPRRETGNACDRGAGPVPSGLHEGDARGCSVALRVAEGGGDSASVVSGPRAAGPGLRSQGSSGKEGALRCARGKGWIASSARSDPVPLALLIRERMASFESEKTRRRSCSRPRWAVRRSGEPSWPSKALEWTSPALEGVGGEWIDTCLWVDPSRVAFQRGAMRCRSVICP